MSWRTRMDQFRAWLHDHATTLRLAASYLVIIMVMSLGFSFIFYQTSERELARQLPPDRLLVVQDGDFGDYRDFLTERIAEGRSHLLDNLILVNVLTFGAGAIVSYVLARRTLEPIERAMDAQARFAADASHELRTPLAAMQTENEVALRNSKLTLERAKELLHSNVEETIRLKTLAEQLLGLARGRGQAVTLGPTNITEAVSQAVTASSKLAEAKAITITNSISVLTAWADMAGLVEVLQILLDNAIKYSHDHTTITLTSEAVDHAVLIHVADQGVGIEPAAVARIFDRFYRADHSRSKLHVEGNGLGLSLVQTIIEQMGGQISVTSRPGKGSTFTVELPAV